MNVRALKLTGVAVGILCLAGTWVLIVTQAQNAVRPSEGATNLVSFLNTAPAPKKIRKFVHDEKTYVEIIGHLPKHSWALLPSGPPAYIFNDAGILIDWTPDRGDTPSFVKQWGNLNDSEFISIEEAKRLVKLRE